MEAWELAGREQIRDTIARYAHCVDGGRFDELVDLFVPDGVLEVEGEAPHRGRNAIRAFVTGVGDDIAASRGAPRIRHHVGNVLVDLDGPDRARARSYFLAVTDTGVSTTGAVTATSSCHRASSGASPSARSGPTGPRRGPGPPGAPAPDPFSCPFGGHWQGSGL